MFARSASLLMLSCLWVLCCNDTASGQDNWPRFRGPQANGVVPDDPRLPEMWDRETNVRWKTRIPGWGWGSPIVWGDRVFITSAVRTEGGSKLSSLFGSKGYGAGESVANETEHLFLLICLDKNTGRLLGHRPPRLLCLRVPGRRQSPPVLPPCISVPLE